ncbi:MAG: hypothetical protein ACJ76H_16325 [Bacteriovoracaceae bacterium]
MKRFALGLFTLLMTTAAFANSVDCYVDKESRYPNGRPDYEVVIKMKVGERASSVVFLQEADSMIPGIASGGPSQQVNLSDSENHLLVSLDVTALMTSGSGNVTSSILLPSGNRYQLRCEGKSE